MNKSIGMIFIGVMLAGCGATRTPIIDVNSSPAMSNGRSYVQDLTECKALAQQADPVEDGAKGALGGAAVGAALGAIVGAFAGQPGRGAALGGALGGTGGAATGGLFGVNKQEKIVANCMQGRGWNVVE